ncbi:MAG: hypothetical protein WCZ65_08550 [Lysobacteraceae bacterium]
MSIINLEREVLEMPVADRARLVQKLLLRLENLPQDELDMP